MSEREALARFRDWRAARGRKVATRFRRRSRCIKLVEPASIGLVAVPVSIELATLMVAVGTSSFCTRRLTVAQKFGAGC